MAKMQVVSHADEWSMRKSPSACPRSVKGDATDSGGLGNRRHAGLRVGGPAGEGGVADRRCDCVASQRGPQGNIPTSLALAFI